MVNHTQTIRRQQSTDCLSVLDHFVGLALKELFKKAVEIERMTCVSSGKNCFRWPAKDGISTHELEKILYL